MSPLVKTPRVWALSDLHWGTRRPMHEHHEGWRDHRERIIAAWRARVGPYDLVLVPGDVTFAHSDPHPDLLALHRLPGQKVLVPGNHDGWCRGMTRLQVNALLELYPTLHMLSHGHPTYETGPHLIVGYQGAEPPESPTFRRRSHRQALVEASVAAEHAAHVRASYHKVIVITHYPPSEEERAILAPLGVDLWLHGHCHVGGLDQDLVAEWEQRAVPTQRCISADYLGMIPLEVTEGIVHVPLGGYVDIAPRPAIA